MDNKVLKCIPLKCGSAIKTLSIISLIFNTISLFHLNSEPVTLIICLLLLIVRGAIFVWYIFRLYSRLKSTVLVPIIFALHAPEALFLGSLLALVFGPAAAIGILLVSAVFVLAFVSTLRGFYRKEFIVIAISLCLLFDLALMISCIMNMDYYISHSKNLYLPTMNIGLSTQHIALLLFVLKNDIPAICAISPKKAKAQMGKMKPEQALKYLKERLDLGMITEEEYQAQRAEIIRKL